MFKKGDKITIKNWVLESHVTERFKNMYKKQGFAVVDFIKDDYLFASVTTAMETSGTFFQFNYCSHFNIDLSGKSINDRMNMFLNVYGGQHDL